jgi:hypothetical protein
MKTLQLCSVVLLLAACGSVKPGGADSGAGGGTGGGGSAGAPGGGTGGGSFGADGGLPLALACQTLVARRCDYLVRCQLLGDAEASRRDCAAWLGATWCGPSKWPSRVGSPVATLKYDSSLAQACADAFQSRSCNEWKDVPLACERFLLPNVLMGQGCYGGYTECIEGVCRGASCPRTCQSRGAVGGVCTLTADCVNGLYCRRTPGITGLGQCATYGTTGLSCSGTEPCGPGLSCVAGKCVSPPVAGSPCLGSVCDESAFCVAGADGGLCAPRRVAGAACSDDVQCQSALLCDPVSSTCVAKILSQAGAVCSLRQECPPGTVCGGASAQVNGTCQNPSAGGGACSNSTDCQASLRCGQADGGKVCGPRLSSGISCADDRDCQELNVCLSSSCTRLPLTGESCEVTKKCLFGPCVGVGDGGSVCGAPGGPGAPCQSEGDCASGRCASGQCLTDCAP